MVVSPLSSCVYVEGGRRKCEQSKGEESVKLSEEGRGIG